MFKITVLDHTFGPPHLHILAPLPLLLYVYLNRLPDRQFAGSLADLRQIGAGEALGTAREELQVHVLGDKQFKIYQYK